MPNLTKPIKTFIIEEHHEAFIVWNFAIQQGLIPSTGNTLFHVDEHSDMGTPRFNESIHELNGNLDDIIQFTYKELNIANFIIPSVYIEIINKVYWIRQKHQGNKKKNTKMFVRSYNMEGKRLFSGRLKKFKDENLQNSILFKYYLRTISQVPSKENVILDIDLDYFSCVGDPNQIKETYIEITKDEYNLYAENKYHRLNYCNLGKIDLVTKEGKFYYVFNYYHELYPVEEHVGAETIKKRISFFIEQLKAKKIKPSIICICRSNHSGYTPKHQVDIIQKELLKELNNIYKISEKIINQI